MPSDPTLFLRTPSLCSPSRPAYRLNICIRRSMMAIRQFTTQVKAFCRCPCLRPACSICRNARSTARIREPKQMEPKEVLEARKKDLETTPLFCPLYHQSATMPAAEQHRTFFTTKLPQNKEMKRRNMISGDTFAENSLKSLQKPAWERATTPSAVSREQAQAPAVSVH